jgi:hypothetical protein
MIGRVSMPASVRLYRTRCPRAASHRGWKEPVEFMNHCSTEWAVFLLSLKKFVETGEGEPAAHDVKVRDWHWAWFAEIRSGDRHGVLPKWLMRAPPSFRIAPNALCGQALR